MIPFPGRALIGFVASLVILLGMARKYSLPYQAVVVVFMCVFCVVLGVVFALDIPVSSVLVSAPISIYFMKMLGLKESEVQEEEVVEDVVDNFIERRDRDIERDWIVVKTYMDRSSELEFRRDRALLEGAGVSTYAKTVGFTSLYVLSEQEDEALTLLFPEDGDN